jgi:hypothetical protein
MASQIWSRGRKKNRYPFFHIQFRLTGKNHYSRKMWRQHWKEPKSFQCVKAIEILDKNRTSMLALVLHKFWGNKHLNKVNFIGTNLLGPITQNRMYVAKTILHFFRHACSRFLWWRLASRWLAEPGGQCNDFVNIFAKSLGKIWLFSTKINVNIDFKKNRH